MNLIRYAKQLFLIAAMGLAVSCNQQALTRAERDLISRAPADSAMYVLSIFVPEDSLFLRRTAMPVSDPSDEYVRLLSLRMLATVNHPASLGVGIAAPQVGVGRQIIWVQRFDKEGEPFEVYYNPEILDFSQEMVSRQEGCLSVPGYRGLVERSQHIRIRYMTSDAQIVEEDVEGFTARIFMHEIDHLNGIIYHDRVVGGLRSL